MQKLCQPPFRNTRLSGNGENVFGGHSAFAKIAVQSKKQHLQTRQKSLSEDSFGFLPLLLDVFFRGVPDMFFLVYSRVAMFLL